MRFSLRNLLARAILIAVVSGTGAHACACCTNLGQRNVSVQKLDGGKLAEIAMIRFEKAARLFVGERDVVDVKGISTPSPRYDMKVAQENGRFVFSFHDAQGRTGSLTLLTPRTVSIFEVDPRDTDEEGGLGPGLYKEWKLTSRAAGTGIFAPGVGSGQSITLVLQGRGNSCTSSIDFTHWTLIVHGPKAEYQLFGRLAQNR